MQRVTAREARLAKEILENYTHKSLLAVRAIDLLYVKQLLDLLEIDVGMARHLEDAVNSVRERLEQLREIASKYRVKDYDY